MHTALHRSLRPAHLLDFHSAAASGSAAGAPSSSLPRLPCSPVSLTCFSSARLSSSAHLLARSSSLVRLSSLAPPSLLPRLHSPAHSLAQLPPCSPVWLDRLPARPSSLACRPSPRLSFLARLCTGLPLRWPASPCGRVLAHPSLHWAVSLLARPRWSISSLGPPPPLACLLALSPVSSLAHRSSRSLARRLPRWPVLLTHLLPGLASSLARPCWPASLPGPSSRCLACAHPSSLASLLAHLLVPAADERAGGVANNAEGGGGERRRWRARRRAAASEGGQLGWWTRPEGGGERGGGRRRARVAAASEGGEWGGERGRRRRRARQTAVAREVASERGGMGVLARRQPPAMG